jgi:OST-HTH/LOTUS domain
LMKTILAHHELAGPVETLEAQRASRLAKFSDKSLGTLVKALFETYVVKEGFERELLPEDKTPADRVSLAFASRLSMTPERWELTKAAVEDLVDMRNGLVHHFIEQFDVWTTDGCVHAAAHLDECYDRIDRHLAELSDWAKGMDNARTMAAQFAQSPVFVDMLVSGVAPDGTFEWQHTGIVRALRDAAQALQQGSWARLDQARAWIAERHPEQTPEKYGCKSFAQVLNDSRLFRIEYRALEEGASKVACFRPSR